MDVCVSPQIVLTVTNPPFCRGPIVNQRFWALSSKRDGECSRRHHVFCPRCNRRNIRRHHDPHSNDNNARCNCIKQSRRRQRGRPGRGSPLRDRPAPGGASVQRDHRGGAGCRPGRNARGHRPERGIERPRQVPAGRLRQIPQQRGVAACLRKALGGQTKQILLFHPAPTSKFPYLWREGRLATAWTRWDATKSTTATRSSLPRSRTGRGRSRNTRTTGFESIHVTMLRRRPSSRSRLLRGTCASRMPRAPTVRSGAPCAG